jgi:RNA-binding protein
MRRKGALFSMEISSAQRKFLRSQAHHIDPVVLIGKQGLTDALVRSASEALEAKELIKVRFNEHKEDKKELSQEMAFRTNSQIVGTIGHVSIFYRFQEDPEKRRIELP